MTHINNTSQAITVLPTYANESYFSRKFAYFAVKRTFDFTVAAVLLMLLAPAMLLLAFLVKRGSQGPAIFTQERTGSRLVYRNGRYVRESYTFKFRKFRSMYVNNDDSVHRQFVQAMIKDDDETIERLQDKDIPEESKYKLKNDPRITPIGRIIRKTSLDELPQLWNVIVGDMSLVGPRPAIPYEVEVYTPRHMERLGAQPGITGLWQTTARSSVSFEVMVDLDLEYIRRQSLLLDFKILIDTVAVLFHHKGAV